MIIRLLRWAGGAALALAAWAAVMVAIPFIGPNGRLVSVVGDRGAAVRAIAAAGGRIVEVRGRAVLARSDRPGFARRLYRAGAPLVLEGRIGAGCLGGRSLDTRFRQAQRLFSERSG
jgi:acetyl/propionyl-CoA carboxylase alpha subunit